VSEYVLDNAVTMAWCPRFGSITDVSMLAAQEPGKFRPSDPIALGPAL